MDYQDRITHLIISHIQGQNSEVEEKELEAWRMASEENEALFVRCCSEAHWKDSCRRFVKTNAEHEATRRQLELRLTGRMLRLRLQKWGYAAVIVLMIGVGGLLYNNRLSVGNDLLAEGGEHETVMGLNKHVLLTLEDGVVVDLENEEAQKMLEAQRGLAVEGEMVSYGQALKDSCESVYHTLVVPYGGEYAVTLADSTRVILNAGSRLTYPVYFTGLERRVRLEGEAYFDVAQNKNRPFIVDAGQLEVLVTGTTFGVRAYEGEGEILTTLETGRVKVSDGESEIELRPSEQAVFDSALKSLERAVVDVDMYLGWSKGRVVFDNCKLERIVSDLERWYGIQVVFGRPELRDYRFSLNIKKPDSYLDILKLLGSAGDIQFKTEKDSIVIDWK